MARELPIHNGRMTTDLDANGFKIKNLPPGSGFTQAQADWSQTDATAPDFIKNKPTIPAPVSVDATLTTQGAAADAKAVGDALAVKRDIGDLELRGMPTDVNGYKFRVNGVLSESYDDFLSSWTAPSGTSPTWDVLWDGTSGQYGFRILNELPESFTLSESNGYSADVTFGGVTYRIVGVSANSIATTDMIPAVPSAYTSTPVMDGVASAGSATTWARGDHVHPSDTSKQASLSASQLAAVNSGVTSAKVETWDGYAAQIAQKADATDLPYRLVEPGKWEFSEPQGLTNFSVTGIEYYAGYWTLSYTSDETATDSASTSGSETDLSVVFYVGVSGEATTTATRASLPGHLLDRAGNLVVVSGDTTLTLPDANPGYLRDFLVRLEISGSTVPNISFADPTGESIVYETDGDEFPVPDEAGTWSYSFTENCVAHKFAVSLKKVNEVAAPQAQGGS